VTLSCPGCHAKHKFRDDIAIDKTVYVKCPACGHMMMISPQINNPATAMTPRPATEAPAPLPPEIAAAIAAARSGLYRLELLDLAREELDLDQVAEHIRKGTVGGRDLIAHLDKNDWVRVEEIPELAGALRERRQRDEAEAEAAAPEAEPEAEEDDRPFWRDLPRCLAYPLYRKGSVMLAVNALFVLLGRRKEALPLLVFTLAYALVVVRETWGGKEEAPGWEAFTDIMELFVNALRLLAVTVAAWLPVLALNALIFYGPLGALRGSTAGAARLPDDLEAELSGGAAGAGILPGGLTPAGFAGNLALALIVMCYYPMCVTLLAIHDDIARALSPGRILGAVHRLGSAYGMAVGLCAGLLFIAVVVQIVVTMVASMAEIPWLGHVPTSIVAVYAAFVGLHVLGRMAHENREAFAVAGAAR
jgi:hypothetical protein